MDSEREAAYKDSHDQHPPMPPTPKQPITTVPGAAAGVDICRTALPYLTGEAEEAAKRQIDTLG
jgi:hypothetical protein